MADKTGKISFQGELGAYSHQACRQARPDMEPFPCFGFEDAIAALQEGVVDLAMLPVDNSTYGRVADVHRLLPESGLHIVDETFVRVHINILGVKGAPLSGVKSAISHTVLVPQCRGFLEKHKIKPIIGADTAGSARDVAEIGDPTQAALASPLAGEIYGLDILGEHIEDQSNNTTRFLVTSREPRVEWPEDAKMLTTFVFRVRNIPAALYKVMGGFATNGVNMVKLESYMMGGSFTATQFYADIDGHPDDPAVKRALEEMAYFTTHSKVIGVYPADQEHRAGR